MCDLEGRASAATEADIARKAEETRAIFDIREDSPSDPLAKKPAPEQMDWAGRVAAGPDHLVEDFDLDGMAYYYTGVGGNLWIWADVILGCSLLTARGFTCSGDAGLKNCQAMTIMDLLGARGSNTEIYATDFHERFVLMGHDGPFHLGIAEGRPILCGLGLYHSRSGFEVSVEASVRIGPVTILGLTQPCDGRLKFLAAEGECCAGERLKIGNTDSQLRFALAPAPFINAYRSEGRTHHCALGAGHVLGKLKKVSWFTGPELKVTDATAGQRGLREVARAQGCGLIPIPLRQNEG
jgi:L-arabinose isomerase